MPKSSLRGVRCGAILLVRRLEVWALETRFDASRLITRELLSGDCNYESQDNNSIESWVRPSIFVFTKVRRLIP